MKTQHYSFRLVLRSLGALLFISASLFILARPAHAHTRTDLEDGYALIVGWIEEPPLVGQRNQVSVEILHDGEPVVGAEATLDAILSYGSETFRANINPSETPGLYTIEIIPTVRGRYDVALFGTLDDLEVNVDTAPEEVFPASRLQFPEAEPSGIELQTQVETLTEQLAMTRLIAIGAIVLGLLGAALGLAGRFGRKN